MREVHHAKGVASVKGILVGSLLVLASAPGVAAQESDPTDDEEPRSPCSGFATACGGAVIEREGVQLEVRVPDDVEGLVEFARVHPPRPCTYRAVPPSFDPQVDVAITAGVPAGAVYFIRDCGDGEQWRWYVPGSPFTNDENVLGMIGEAFRRLEPPVPGLVTAPPLGSEVLTGFPMYLAVDEGAFEGLSGSVSAGQFTVTAWVVPVSSRFVPGDGSEPRVCEGRGSVWSAGLRPSAWECTHTFTHTPVHLNGEGEVFEVSARVVYEAWYTVEGPVLAGEFELGSFEGPQVVVEVPVIERRAVRTTAGS